jgi:hypothetical protein
MTFVNANFARVTSSANENAQVIWAYKSSTDNIATVVASAYFNTKITALAVGDVIYIEASDAHRLVRVTSVTTNVTVETFDTYEGSLDLTEGNIFIGDSSSKASSLDGSADTQILVGNGTTMTSVATSGDVTMTNAGVVTISAGAIDNAKVDAAAAIAWSKMAALTEGNLLLGNATNVATVTDFSTDTYIGIGDGTTFNSVAVSGDIAITNAGVTTIQAGAVDEAMINPNTLTGTVAANVANANVIGGLPQLFRINTAGGATANTDVTVTHKIRVIDAWVVNNAAGTASDTIQVFNGASAITDAIDISGADTTLARAGIINDANHEIAAAGTLRITETDGGGSDSPATTVYVLAIRVA